MFCITRSVYEEASGLKQCIKFTTYRFFLYQRCLYGIVVRHVLCVWQVSRLSWIRVAFFYSSFLQSLALILFYSSYLTYALYPEWKMPPCLTSKIKVMEAPNLACGLLFTCVFGKLVLSWWRYHCVTNKLSDQLRVRDRIQQVTSCCKVVIFWFCCFD